MVARGPTLALAFESAAYAMFSIVAELDKYQPTRNVTIRIEGDDRISLLERFLSSLLVIFDGDSLLPLDFEITSLSDNCLTCNVSAREIGEDIDWMGPSVKAVTYHQMAVEESNGEWQARVIFDV